MGSRKLPGHIIRRSGGSWRVVLCVGGKVHQFGPRLEPILAATTTAKADVAEWAWRKLEELKRAAAREQSGLPGRVRFSELLRRYRAEELPDKASTTQRCYEISMRPAEHYFIGKLGDPMLDQIHSAHVKAFLSWRRTHGPDGTELGRPLAPRSRAKDRAVLHQLFQFADALELREGNPVRRVPKIKGDARQPVILTQEQYDALLDASDDPMVRLYVLILGESGARDESEALWLRWEDVDFERGFLAIVSGRDGHRTKGGKSRFVPMTARLRTALRNQFAAFRLSSGSAWILHHTRTRRRHLRGQRVGSFRGAVANAVVRANAVLLREKKEAIPDRWVMHDLRHRRVTTWLGEGKSAVHVQQAMGHSSIQTTMGYYEFLPDHLKALVEEHATSEHSEAQQATA